MSEQEIITPQAMRDLERSAIESGAVTGLELMERAGERVVEAIFEEWPEIGKDRAYATVICGPGNNGGDGFVIARLLAERGWAVEMMQIGNRETYSDDANAMLNRVPASVLIGEITPEEAAYVGSAIFETDSVLIIDAVFGIGLSRPLDRNFAELLCSDLSLYRSADLGVKCVSVDIPSGLSSETGMPLGHAFKAHMTVTFHRMKPGHVMGHGPDFCGKVVVKDIGL